MSQERIIGIGGGKYYMGMFDTFFDENTKIKCEHCNKENTFENGVQSKNFDCILDNYDVGDVVRSSEDFKFVLNSDWCEFCGERINVYLSFFSGIFVGMTDNKEEAIKKSESFDIVTHYKTVWGEKQKFSKKALKFERQIKDTIKFHSKPPDPSNFNILFNLHYKFIDYDIIKTLKNILKSK